MSSCATANTKGELIFNKKVSASFDGKRNNHRNKPRDKWIIYPGGCPAIVSVETWDRAQAILRTHRRGNGMASQHPYLISRLVFCAHCGNRMYGEYRRDRNASYRTYRCGHKERTCNCVSKAIRGDALEHYVVDAISGLLTSWDNAGNIAETIYNGSERAMVEDIDHCVLKTSLERLYAELDNLSSSIAKVGYEDLLGAKLAYLKQEISEKEGELKRREEVLEAQRYSQEEVYRHIHSILVRYNEHDVCTQAQCMLIELVDKIMISNDKVDVHLRVEFPTKVAGEGPLVYEHLLSISRNELFRLYPMDRYNDDWAVMDKLYDLCTHHEAR